MSAVARAQDAVPGEFVIKFRSSESPQKIRSHLSGLKVEAVKTSELTGSELVSAQSGENFDHEYAKKLLASGAVEYIEPNYVYSVNTVPNDSSFSQLWGMNNTGQTGGTADVDIDAPEAWGVTTGSDDVVVGIVDTGLNYLHPDLAANAWTNPGEIPGNNIDDDGNGVIDDVHGFNALTAGGDPLDDHGHGSHCAGTIGGIANNSLGVAGVNWHVKIMGLKFLSSSGYGTLQNAIDAINYAVQMKERGVNLKVLSNSWGGGGFSQALGDAIQAANDRGILFVAAAGNDANDNDAGATYPANYDIPNVVSVAAVDHNGNLASFSNFGQNTVDVAGPGVNILSTVLGSAYAVYSGTSMATPHVSGVAALVASNEPTLTMQQLKDRLINTAKPLPALSGLIHSGAMVSAYNALTNTIPDHPLPVNLIRYGKALVTSNYDTNLGTRVLQTDDGYAVTTLPFTFPYFGSSFTRLAISANGRILPLGLNESAPNTADYSNNLNSGINPFHDDLYPHSAADSGVWVKSDSSSATITWVVVPYAKRQGSIDAELRFQVYLKSDGTIDFRYKDTYVGDPAYDYGASASIGLVPPSAISGKKLIISNNTANPAEVGNNKALRMDQTSIGARSDFDGDHISDVVVWRPSSGMWYVLTSSSEFDYAQHLQVQLGLRGDIPLSVDFDGDGKSDFAVFRPTTATWYWRASRENYTTIKALQWGLRGDIAVPGDFDGDSRSDIAVYRPTKAAFYILKSSSGNNRVAALSGSATALLTVNLGGKANDPVVGDFTGDGTDDLVTIWQLQRFWTLKKSNNTYVSSTPWGAPGDTPLACDWDGDGTTDRVMVRVNSSNTLDWYIVTQSGLVYTATFGSLGDVPSCNKDYDGDGEIDRAVYRGSSGTWFVRSSLTSETLQYPFGLNGDIGM